MKLADVADEITRAVKTVPSLSGRAYAYPPESITPPAAIVAYPGHTFDLTYQRGADTITVNVVVLVSNSDARAATVNLYGYLDGSGAESIKQAVDDYGGYTVIDSVRVVSAEIQDYFLADVQYLAAIFELDVIGSGT